MSGTDRGYLAQRRASMTNPKGAKPSTWRLFKCFWGFHGHFIWREYSTAEYVWVQVWECEFCGRRNWDD